MNNKIKKVKIIFDEVKELRNEINTLFLCLDGRISKLSEIYNEFIKNTKQIRTPDVKSFIFSLDSFYFQNNLLKREYKNLKDFNIIIINHMYGEYYKLYRLITDFIVKSRIDDKLPDILKNRSYPTYDDLDEEKLYDFNLIIQLNEDIMNIVNYLITIRNEKEMSLKNYHINQGFGLNINNFVSTFNYEFDVLTERIHLYEKYLDFFYHTHAKLFNRLLTRISLLDAQLNTDIKFEGGIMGQRKDNKSLIEDMNIKGLNKKAARDLRKSITGISSPLSLLHDSSISNFSISSEDDISNKISATEKIFGNVIVEHDQYLKNENIEYLQFEQSGDEEDDQEEDDQDDEEVEDDQDEEENEEVEEDNNEPSAEEDEDEEDEEVEEEEDEEVEEDNNEPSVEEDEEDNQEDDNNNNEQSDDDDEHDGQDESIHLIINNHKNTTEEHLINDNVNTNTTPKLTPNQKKNQKKRLRKQQLKQIEKNKHTDDNIDDNIDDNTDD